jgi:hypothetical protein
MHIVSTDRLPIAFRTWDFPPARKVAGTRTVIWKNGQLVTKLKIHKLDTTGFDVMTKSCV